MGEPRLMLRSGRAGWAALLLAVSVALVGCGEDPPPGNDAGELPDAGFDAGDPGIPDAGKPDAGNDADAGSPPELLIQKVLPPRAPTTGNVQVVLQGSGFVRGVADRATEAKKNTTLKFGSNTVIDFQIIDDGTIDVRVPPGKAGLTNITITNANGEYVCSGCFTYFEEVFLQSVTPGTGPLSGGNEVTLKGGGFTPELQVLFGSLSAPELTVVSSSELKVKVPRAAVTGAVDITAFSKNGVGVLRRAYTYAADLRITDVVPLTGPVAGGTSVTLTGTGFTGATEVLFGGVPATSFTVDGDGQLTATVPAGAAAGAVPVTVTSPSGTWTARDAFTYVSGAGFGIYGVFPHLGLQEGGTVVTVTGEGLDAGNLAIAFGGQAATILGATANTAEVVVPARGMAARKVDVSATAGAQTDTLPAGFTYRLRVESISPQRGPAGGGTAATVRGTLLPADAEIFIGALPATVTAVNGGGTAEVITPRGQGGAATAVWVREAADPENEEVLPGAFTFDEALSVGGVNPGRGAIAGGTLVTVLGSGFGEGTLVTFGANVAKDIKVIDSHTLTCRIPKGNVGAVDVGVKRLNETDDLPGGFSYFDPRSISGGLSGGPIKGTLNVSVLDSSPGAYGTPVPLANVMLGLDSNSPLQGVTDSRGQLTISDPTLVKAQTVTVFKDGYESVTVTNVNAENLTVFVARVGGDGSPGSPPPGVPPSIISGRVSGFKSPRPLGPNETLEARVFVAQTNVYQGPPFGGRLAEQRTSEKWIVTKEDGEYLVLTGAGLRAVYAVLGIVNNQARSFEPVLMGVHRGITVSADQPATNRNIVLDMELNVSVPITIDQPVSISGVPANNEVFAWLDLGAEGLIPNPNNWGTGTSPSSSVSGTQSSLTFPNFPHLDGSNFVFMNLAYEPNVGRPYSLFFRRQPGDLSLGVKVGPMLATPVFLQPKTPAAGGTAQFTGTISWATEPAPSPDITQVIVLKPTLAGAVALWSIILPGSEQQVTLPPAAVQKLRNEEAGTTLFVQIISSRSPKFSYNQWTYDTLGSLTWSAYTVNLSDPFLP